MNNYNDKSKSGVLGIEYAKQRQTSRALKYRLWRRTNEVHKAINKYLNYTPKNILDLGTADGEMIFDLSKTFKETRFLGIEYNSDLVAHAQVNKTSNVEIMQGDVNEVEKFNDKEYDVVIATAVIEHVDNAEFFMNSVKSLLIEKGILILTAPDPMWEEIATMVGHLQDEQHNEVPNLKRLRDLAEKSELKVELLQKFMISPIGLIFEEKIETMLRTLRLDFMLANQLLVARKTP